jgi:hypothetical protein
LTSNFISNTRPNSYDFSLLQGKMFIIRYDVTQTKTDLEKPLAILDLKTRKQVHYAWGHRPVDADAADKEFVVIGEDGTIAFIGIDAIDKPTREITIARLTSGKRISVKK